MPIIVGPPSRPDQAQVYAIARTTSPTHAGPARRQLAGTAVLQGPPAICPAPCPSPKTESRLPRAVSPPPAPPLSPLPAVRQTGTHPLWAARESPKFLHGHECALILAHHQTYSGARGRRVLPGLGIGLAKMRGSPEMKKFGMLLMCLSLGLFTVGCQPEETTTPVGNGDAAAPPRPTRAAMQLSNRRPPRRIPRTSQPNSVRPLRS